MQVSTSDVTKAAFEPQTRFLQYFDNLKRRMFLAPSNLRGKTPPVPCCKTCFYRLLINLAGGLILINPVTGGFPANF